MLACIGYYNRCSPLLDTTIDARLYRMLQSILAYMGYYNRYSPPGMLQSILASMGYYNRYSHLMMLQSMCASDDAAHAHRKHRVPPR